MKPITVEILVKCGASSTHAARYVDPLNELLPLYGVTTFLRLAHFISQILHESIRLTRAVENLNYSADRLVETWPKRFPNLGIAKAYAKQPEKLGNYVYANRLGNGSPESGDGYKYRGRGPIQNTGKEKYVAQSKKYNVDYVNHPEWLERPFDGLRASLDYWKDRNLNFFADKDDTEGATKRINGGLIGLTDRKALLVKCKATLKVLFE